jgi:Leucine-rich repeat (LRR) protein
MKTILPIGFENEFYDIEKLNELLRDIHKVRYALKKLNMELDGLKKNRLQDLTHKIAHVISSGYNDKDAIYKVSHDYNIPIREVYLAYYMREKYKYSYERYATNYIVKILKDAGLSNLKVKKILQFNNCPIMDIEKTYNNFDKLKKMKYFDIANEA